MKYLRPMYLRPQYFTPIEEEINRLIDELIYRPLLEILHAKYPEFKNSRSALRDAIARGAVWYADGKFEGSFSAGITRELRDLGATYNRASRTFSLAPVEVPADLRIAQAQAEARVEQLREDLLRALDNMDPASIDTTSQTAQHYRDTVTQMRKDFRETIPAIDAISIVPTFHPGQEKLIAEQWGQNLNLYIKDWAAQDILKLREDIQRPILAGRRAESFHSMLQQTYGVSKRKAKFLARQETSLLMSKFHETKCRDLGIQRYKWSGANDARERPDHRALNGKIFSFSEPPVTDRRTGARNNPGEDFGCRCVAIPIIE